MASSSSSSSSSLFSSCINYEVFLSFRGMDTRDSFTSHLFKELSAKKKIKTFIDEDINKGERISADLLDAIIEGSKISIIIFSEHYADSKWCLDELLKILECKEMNGQIVIPVFYHVHSSDVRNQIGDFGKAFWKNAKKFKKMPKKVQKWRDALKEASYLLGYESKKIRPEAKLVDIIVEDVLKKLQAMTVSTNSNGLVGINSRIEQVKSLLSIELSDFRIVGIWGMGGIGKTTIAETIFNQIYHEFEGKSFIANVREKSKGGGLEQLRERFLYEIFDENIKVGTSRFPEYIKKRLQHMKVFVVLDDVNHLEQLEFLAGGLNAFGPGSRIIVTTRDKSVLDKFGVTYIYKVQALNYYEAKELFCNYAFREDHRNHDLHVLSKSLIYHGSGNPLALKVLGSSLHRKSKDEWKNMLDKLQRNPHPQIHDLLKISYDELTWEEKNIFLDIACFFNGYDKNKVTTILADIYSMHVGVKVLIDKSLVMISFNNELQMHDLLQEMGREIVRQECEKEPEKRSRLWDHNDIYHVLKKNKGTESIEAISLDMSKDIHLGSRAFANMCNLRLLKVYKLEYYGASDMNFRVHLPEGLEYFPDKLRYLYWDRYPLKTLPINFSAENLIEVSLPYSQIEQLWEGKKEALRLKFIDLQHSYYLTRIPDPLETPNLEKIILAYCKGLSCFPSYVQIFSNLVFLCCRGCVSLNHFPGNIHFESPIDIDFSECISLTEFPSISGNVIELDLSHSAIEEVPSSIERLTTLRKLILRGCKRLTCLPTNICKLKSLYWLDLGSCSKFERFPEIMEEMGSLKCINLGSTNIKELSSSVELLTGLTTLFLCNCLELGSLPTNLRKLKSEKFIKGDESTVSQLPSSIKLEEADSNGWRGLESPRLSGLSNLTGRLLCDSDPREIPQYVGCLSSLEILELRGNNFKNLAASIKQLSRLSDLYLDDCAMLESLPEMPRSLKLLSAKNCQRLESLPKLPERLESVDASLLETLYQSSDAFSWQRLRQRFIGCQKLMEKANEILAADFQLRIRHMAVAVLYEKLPAGFGIFISGSAVNIPEWFTNRCSGSSITIQLPPHCYNIHFVGFALCAVIGFEDDSDVTGLSVSVSCSYRFGIKDDISKTFSYTLFVDSDEDQIMLGFEACCTARLPDSVSFDFYHNRSEEKSLKVKCCGVCPLYAHPNEYLPKIFSVNMVPPTEAEFTDLFMSEFHYKDSTSETSGSISTSDDEELEPTLCEEQRSSVFSQIVRRSSVGVFTSLIVIFAFLLFILSPIPPRKIGIW